MSNTAIKPLEPKEIIKRLPVRFTYDNNYFNDKYQGIPIGGYTQIFEKMLSGIEVRLDTDFLKEKIITKNVPTLGICLGMQILTQSSEEGKLAGLSLVKAKTKRITSTNGLKIPHMGWNYVNVKKKENLCDGLDNKDFYFVHSYYVECENEQDVLLETNYHKSFTSAFSSGNIYGVQFHPEKSHKHGFKLFENFIKIC